MSEKDALALEIIDRPALERLIENPPQTYQERDQIALRLHNAMVRKRRRATVMIDFSDIMDLLQQPGLDAHLATILRGFLVRSFFAVYSHTFQDGGTLTTADLENSDGELGQIVRFLARDQSENGQRAGHLLLEAGLAYRQKQIAPAYAAFDRLRACYEAGEEAYYADIGVQALRPFPDMKALAQQKADTEADIVFDSKPNFPSARPTIVVALNQTYYDRYAEAFIASGKDHVNIHFHVANPNPKNLSAAEHVKYSFETCEEHRPYLASMRFIHAPKFLQHYQKPILITDADGWFYSDPRPLFSVATYQDIALSMTGRIKHYLPWQTVSGQLVLARPTHKTFAFFEGFANLYAYLAHQHGGTRWWVDQALLATMLHISQELESPPSILCGRLWAAAGFKTRISKSK